jgi:integrase
MMIRCVRIKLKRLGDKAICWIPIITDSDLHVELLKMRQALATETRYEVDEDFVCPELAHRYTGSDSSPQAGQLYNRITKLYPGRSFKTFRSTFASNLANSGMNIGLATKMTGHSDPKSLMIYVRPDPNALREGLEKALEYGKNKHDQTGLSIPGHVIFDGGTTPLREDERDDKKAPLPRGKKQQT